jgi:hypothetical protein
MKNLPKIKALFYEIDSALFTINGTLSYPEVTEKLTDMANLIHESDDMSDDGYELWSLGESSNCALDSLIVGAYWHYSDWHGGQWSDAYAALCALGNVFSPGMSSPADDEFENPAQSALNDMAELHYNKKLTA